MTAGGASREASVGTQNGPARLTIGIDTGGTFTDCYVTGGGDVVIAKADTTQHDLSQGVLACLDHAAEALGLERGELLLRTDVIRLTTTIGTNTFINRTGARIGLLVGATLAGRISELANGVPLAQDLILPVPEDVEPGNDREVRAATRSLLERGARILVIALNSGTDLPEREARVRAVIAEDYPRHYLGAVPVLTSHKVTPVADGILRIQTALLNAYIHPVMSRFLYRVEDQLREDGYCRPLQIGNANGGTSRVAKTAALRTWGSGPAGGVAAAAEMARHLGLEHAVAVDIGGTSTDIGVISGGRWGYEIEPSIEGVAVALPMLGLRSTGIGCGSIARVVDGDLEVGPESAGAQPGPASYGLGGLDATVTDAACCLGFFDPAHFLGGRRALDIGAAKRAIAENVAGPLGVEVEAAAARVIDRTATLVAKSVHEELSRTGVDAHRCALLATGGGGGLLGHAIGARLGAPAVYAFPISPVFSAFGVSRLDVLHTYEILPRADTAKRDLAAVARSAIADMRGEGIDADQVRLRYEGERSDGDGVVVEDLGGARSRVVDAVRARGETLRLVRVKATARRPREKLAGINAATRVPKPKGSREIHWTGSTASAPLFDWTNLPKGMVVTGPAVLETAETTLIIPPDAEGTVGRLGEVKMMRLRVSRGRPKSRRRFATGAEG